MAANDTRRATQLILPIGTRLCLKFFDWLQACFAVALGAAWSKSAVARRCGRQAQWRWSSRIKSKIAGIRYRAIAALLVAVIAAPAFRAEITSIPRIIEATRELCDDLDSPIEIAKQGHAPKADLQRFFEIITERLQRL